MGCEHRLAPLRLTARGPKSSYLSRTSSPSRSPSTSLPLRLTLSSPSGFDMARQKKDDTSERRFQIEEEIWTRHTARIAVGLPPDSPEPKKEEEKEQQPIPMFKE